MHKQFRAVHSLVEMYKVLMVHGEAENYSLRDTNDICCEPSNHYGSNTPGLEKGKALMYSVCAPSQTAKRSNGRSRASPRRRDTLHLVGALISDSRAHQHPIILFKAHSEDSQVW